MTYATIKPILGKLLFNLPAELGTNVVGAEP
jgi:hypothetical protein